MRFIGYIEILEEKCHMCGSKHKVHTEILDDYNNIIGYSLKCCNCGRDIEFLDNVKMHNGCNCGEDQEHYKYGEQTCITPNGCRFKDCKLYNKPYDPNKHKPEPYHPIPQPKCNFNKNETITYIEHKNRFL